MKQFICKSCESIDLFIEEENKNIRLYCSNCGTYQETLNKNDKLAFEEYKKSLAPIKRIANNLEAMESILNEDGSIVSKITNLIVAEKERLEFVDNRF